MHANNPYQRIKRQAAALFICMAGLLTIGILHVMSDNADSLLRSHAQESATNWANYFVEVTPNVESLIQTGKPAAEVIEKYRNAGKVNRIKRFTVLDAIGRPVYTFQPGANDTTAAGTLTPENRQFISQQLVKQMTGMRGQRATKPVLNAAIVPIIKDGLTVGALHVVVDQSNLKAIFLDAAVAGGWDILILVNMVLLACWFIYVTMTRVAKRYNDLTSRTDQLTGLPSRNAFVEELDDALARSEAGDQMTGVMMVKIDRFRELNDLLGHDGADAILREVARRLEAATAQHGYVARISGNTFGLSYPNLESSETASEIGNGIIASLAQPFTRRGKRIQPKASIGVCLSPEDGTESDILMKRADIAQFIAHEHGGNQLMFFDPTTAARFAEQHELENLIIKACDEQLFELHYQPLYNLGTKQLTGFEALIRLPDEKGGMVAPDRFVPTLEALRRIDEIGAWVLAEACRTASNWPQSIGVSVNLSPIQFRSGQLIDDVKFALSQSGMSAERLELEVTEGLLLDNTDLVRAQLAELQGMGIKIALDDFGTGYSSLNYLWRFPFDRIKVDRSFVSGMEQSEQAKGILKIIVELAATMNLPITAEGIETERQLAFLTELGCHTGQGYYFGRPQPATQVAATLIADVRREIAATEQPAATASKVTSISAAS